ncbi:MAG: PAS domain-containing sensor histidine kinase [Pyrinomonadaceae bacterium]|nr:PAS domain-containing sensor histidine kinase [Sphingobacteriaceae bacterium]
MKKELFKISNAILIIGFLVMLVLIYWLNGISLLLIIYLISLNCSIFLLALTIMADRNKAQLPNANQHQLPFSQTVDFSVIANLVEQSFIGVYVIQDGKFKYVNARMADILGYSVLELLNIDSVYSAIAEPDRHLAEKCAQATLRGEVAAHPQQIRALKKNGSLIFTEILGSLTECKGKPAVLCLLIDKTDKKIADDLLSQEKRLTNLIVNSLQGIFFIRNQQGKYLKWNKNFELMTGYSESEILNLKPYEFIALSDKEKVKNCVRQIFKSGVTASIEANSVMKDGSTRPLLLKANAFTTSEEQLLLVSGIDISQPLKAEAELRRTKANLQSILDITDVAYVLVDKNFSIIAFNHMSDEFASNELKLKIAIGKNILSYIPDEKKPAWERIASGVKDGRQFKYETSYQQQDDSINWYLIKVFSVTDENLCLGFVISVVNITERKRQEIHREKITEDLVQRNKDFEQFAYIVSHNIRLPVANILGISELLRGESLDVDERTHLQEMLSESVCELDKIIIDLNTILQLKHEVEEKYQLVNFADLIEQIKSNLHSQLQQENVEIVTHFEELNQTVTLKSYLYSIFYNLIVNSVKFRQDGISPSISIFTKKKGDKIIFRFIDNGLGINLSKHQKDIFKMYKRFHQHIPGKGMGLFIVKTQVQILGGSIDVSSILDIGSDFTIELPFVDYD